MTNHSSYYQRGRRWIRHNPLCAESESMAAAKGDPKCWSDPISLNFSVWMVTGVFDMTGPLAKLQIVKKSTYSQRTLKERQDKKIWWSEVVGDWRESLPRYWQMQHPFVWKSGWHKFLLWTVVVQSLNSYRQTFFYYICKWLNVAV